MTEDRLAEAVVRLASEYGIAGSNSQLAVKLRAELQILDNFSPDDVAVAIDALPLPTIARALHVLAGMAALAAYSEPSLSAE